MIFFTSQITRHASQEMESARRGRKLCFHERDFIAGCSIVDNIVTCISQSRRAIIVISRDFCASKWCQYEVQVALANMHKRRRGLFLVPLMLQVGGGYLNHLLLLLLLNGSGISVILLTC